MFVLQDVFYSYKTVDEQEIPALRGVTLNIPKGSLFAIVGGNGSGKSTLAKHLNALLLPDSGQVSVNGMPSDDENNIGAIRRLVGYVMQNPDNQIIASSVEDDVAFGPENIGVKREEIALRITESLAMVGLSGFEKFDPLNLSGGQKQRVAIAGALALHPQAIVLDEATAMLDPQGVVEIWQVIENLRANNTTVVIVTHNPAEILMCDLVAVLKNGAVMQCASPREIFKQRDHLAEWNIDLPPAAHLAVMLSQLGCQKELNDVLTVDELVEALCK